MELLSLFWAFWLWRMFCSLLEMSLPAYATLLYLGFSLTVNDVKTKLSYNQTPRISQWIFSLMFFLGITLPGSSLVLCEAVKEKFGSM